MRLSDALLVVAVSLLVAVVDVVVDKLIAVGPKATFTLVMAVFDVEAVWALCLCVCVRERGGLH